MFVALVASTCALHMPAMMPRRAIVTMSDSDNMAIPDPNFVGDELANTWERAGKGKPRWKPGDDTGDAALDARLLYSNWVLNPMSLHVKDGDTLSTSARLVMGWLDLPFKPIASDEPTLPRLDGPGVPDPGGKGGLCTYGEICSFAFAVAKPPPGGQPKVSPATGREDVAAWLAAPSAATFEPLLFGKQADDDGTPCLNAWGISLDDAAVLPVLKSLGPAEASDKVKAYVEGNCAKASTPSSQFFGWDAKM